MKALEQFVIRARSRYRQGRARVGLGGRPSLLVVRMDDLDAPVPLPSTTLKLDDWLEAVVRVVEWSGALPVRVISRADHRLLGEMVRFAHRLECPTSLRTTSVGMTRARADELVDSGLDAVAVRAAGVTDATQATLGERATDLWAALDALTAARASRGARLDIAVEVPFGPPSARELRELLDAARRRGADGVRVAAPWSGGAWDSGAVDALGHVLDQAPFLRNVGKDVETLRAYRGEAPGVRRVRGRCPVGSTRLELLPDGSVGSCPYKSGWVSLGDAMGPAWAALGGHREQIQACDRACHHPELVP